MIVLWAVGLADYNYCHSEHWHRWWQWRPLYSFLSWHLSLVCTPEGVSKYYSPTETTLYPDLIIILTSGFSLPPNRAANPEHLTASTVKKDCDSSIPNVSVQYTGLISQAVTLMSCPVDFGTLIKSYSCSRIVTDISNSSMHQNIRYLLTYFYNINQFNYIKISEWPVLTVCKLKGYNNWGVELWSCFNQVREKSW